jgi:hypothetical protein
MIFHRLSSMFYPKGKLNEKAKIYLDFTNGKTLEK